MKNTKQAENKMYLTAAEAKALGLPSADEQIRRWNELQAQIRKEEREFVRAFTPNKYGEYA